MQNLPSNQACGKPAAVSFLQSQPLARLSHVSRLGSETSCGFISPEPASGRPVFKKSVHIKKSAPLILSVKKTD
jgi:hypothetical protein